MRFVAMLPLLVLAACSSSNSDNGFSSDDLDRLHSMNAMAAADLPTEGSAKFQGDLEMEIAPTDGDGGDVTTADLDMNMDFGSGDLSGTASNFHNTDVGALGGVATIDGGLDGDTVYAGIDGILTGTDAGESFTVDLDLSMQGKFVTDDVAAGPKGLVGTVEGSAVMPDGMTADIRSGDFAAVREN